MTAPILMTAENPTGWKLEDLVAQLQVELQAKSEKISGIDQPAAKNYLKTNKQIIARLKHCESLQRNAIEFATQNPIDFSKVD